jgi:hypothetical protein
MQHIKNYMKKIEQAIVTMNKKEKPTKGGLLSPTGARKEDGTEKTNDLLLIAKFVDGIRTAKEEMKNGK